MDKYQKSILMGLVVVIAIAVLDILAMHSGILGSPTDYTNGNYLTGWWSLFYSYTLVFFLILPIAYFFIIKRDKSEAIGIFASSLIAYWTGLADVSYFLLQGKLIPSVLPWLNGNPVIYKISNIFGFESVTNISLLICVSLGLVTIYFVTKLLRRIN